MNAIADHGPAPSEHPARKVEPAAASGEGRRRPSPTWEALVSPGRVFLHPEDVVAAPDLTREEKRAILASWASDAWSVESAPALRQCPGFVGRTVPLDSVLDALRALDPREPATPPGPGDTPRRPKRLSPIRWLTRWPC